MCSKSQRKSPKIWHLKIDTLLIQVIKVRTGCKQKKENVYTFCRLQYQSIQAYSINYKLIQFDGGYWCFSLSSPILLYCFCSFALWSVSRLPVRLPSWPSIASEWQRHQKTTRARQSRPRQVRLGKQQHCFNFDQPLSNDLSSSSSLGNNKYA